MEITLNEQQIEFLKSILFEKEKQELDTTTRTILSQIINKFYQHN